MIAQTEARPELIGLTDAGRIRAVLHTLEARWPTMSPADRDEARELLGRLASCYRRAAARRPAAV